MRFSILKILAKYQLFRCYRAIVPSDNLQPSNLNCMLNNLYNNNCLRYLCHSAGLSALVHSQNNNCKFIYSFNYSVGHSFTRWVSSPQP